MGMGHPRRSTSLGRCCGAVGCSRPLKLVASQAVHHHLPQGADLAKRKAGPTRVTVHVRDLENQARQNPPPKPYWRPNKRWQCAQAARPCPYIGCRHHLYLDFTQLGSVKFNFGDNDEILASMPETCSLDVADRGDHDMTTIAKLLNVTPARVQQEVVDALAKLRALGLDHSDILGTPKEDEADDNV